MTIAHQPVTAPDPVSTRSAIPRSPRELVPIDRPSRGATAARILGLLVATAMCMALATAVVAGTALFALLNFTG